MVEEGLAGKKNGTIRIIHSQLNLVCLLMVFVCVIKTFLYRLTFCQKVFESKDFKRDTKCIVHILPLFLSE